MYDWELEQARKRYARLVHVFESGTLPEKMRGRITEDGIRVFGELVYRKGETEGAYLERYINLKRKKYPINIYAFLMEGNWTTADCFIPDGENSRIEDNAEWEDDLRLYVWQRNNKSSSGQHGYTKQPV